MARAGILFILVGPSAAGKNTLMQRAMDRLPDLHQLPTATTREPRDGEVEGIHHRFVTREKFNSLIRTGALVEYQPVHGGDFYGTPRAEVEQATGAGQDLIADIEFLGAGAVRAAYPDHTVLVFVTPSNLDDLAERIRRRAPISPKALTHRLARARYELAFAPQCDYTILNNLVEPAAEHLCQVILTERARRRGELIAEHDRLRLPERHVTVSPLCLRDDCLLVHSDGAGANLPTFEVENLSQPPHTVLEERLTALLGRKPKMEAVLDKRFDFVPPYHVDVSVIPHDVYLNFYYRCDASSPDGPGWTWKHVADLALPTSLARHLRASDLVG